MPDPGTAVASELTAVPFWPQDKYQCGPAALATVLASAGVEITPDALVDGVYLPSRRGSLQAEMLAAARSRDRLTLPVEPTPAQFAHVLGDGHPILVFQNLALSWLPVWHYAVVIGMEPDGGPILLRSGTSRRQEMPRDDFWASMARADEWAYAVARADAPPDFVDVSTWLEEAVALESIGRTAAASRAYEAAVERWPEAPAAWQYAGGARFTAGDALGAARALRRAHDLAPTQPVVVNNYAHVLGVVGCPDRARAVLDQFDREQEAVPERWSAALAETRSTLGDQAGDCSLSTP